MKIASVVARQLLDCKARPLVEVEITTDTGHIGRGASPTGTSVGEHEAFVLRDGDRAEYDGLSVHQAISAVIDEIAPVLVGAELDDPRSLDQVMIELDGTQDKHRLGGNAIYSTSIALLRTASAAAGTPTYTYVGALLGLNAPTTVPAPSFNMINGGRYGDIFQTFSEFLVVPYRADSIESAVEKGVRLFGVLGEVLGRRLGRAPLIASSYGYVAPSSDPRVVMQVLAEAVERAGCADVMAFALDCASSEVYDKGPQTYAFNGEQVTAEALIDYARALSEDFPMVFIEDLLDGDDWGGFTGATQTIDRSIILGDDLIVTNDDVVMDLAVALGAPFQKNGAPRSGERIEKLNFLLRAAERIPDCALADVSALVRF